MVIKYIVYICVEREINKMQSYNCKFHKYINDFYHMIAGISFIGGLLSLFGSIIYILFIALGIVEIKSINTIDIEILNYPVYSSIAILFGSQFYMKSNIMKKQLNTKG